MSWIKIAMSIFGKYTQSIIWWTCLSRHCRLGSLSIAQTWFAWWSVRRHRVTRLRESGLFVNDEEVCFFFLLRLLYFSYLLVEHLLAVQWDWCLIWFSLVVSVWRWSLDIASKWNVVFDDTIYGDGRVLCYFQTVCSQSLYARDVTVWRLLIVDLIILL